MTDDSIIYTAAAFAARAHKHQLRKDKETPYVSHVFRVCMVVRHLFQIECPKVLAAALLHDTIEDTTTDYDDLEQHFGNDVADWVVALTKDMRLPDAIREPAYAEAIAKAGWQVHICKLADIYDNISDTISLTDAQRKHTLGRAEKYLEEFAHIVAPEARRAYDIVSQRLQEILKN